MLVRPKQLQDRFSTRVRLGNEEFGFVEEFRYLRHVMTADCLMIRILKNNSGGKMHLAICWLGNSHLHLLRQKSNCSSHIVTKFIDVLSGVIHTRTPLENLLSVIVTHSNDLLMSPDTPLTAFAMQLTISRWSRKSAYSLMSRVTTSLNSIFTAIFNSDAYQWSPLMDKWESMLYYYYYYYYYYY